MIFITWIFDALSSLFKNASKAVCYSAFLYSVKGIYSSIYVFSLYPVNTQGHDDMGYQIKKIITVINMGQRVYMVFRYIRKR